MRFLTAILVTLPKTVSWEDYEKELRKGAAGEILNFKVPNFPLRVGRGDRCYIAHKGFIKGWMEITGFSEGSFICTTTGKRRYGKFIQRSGEFHPVEAKVECGGFQGFKYITIRVGVDYGPFAALHNQ